MAIHKLRGLEYLVAVVDHGGFNAAARKLGLSAASVNRLVRALEAELGQQLIDRSTQPLRPFPHAVDYINRARMLLGELVDLDATLRDQSQAPRGTIKVAAQSVVSHFVLADALPAFHERYPDIRIELKDAGDSRELARLGADALLQFGWPPEQDAVLRTLADTRWLVVATPSFWARHRVPEHPSALTQMPCLLFSTPFGEVLRRWAFERDGQTVTVDVDGWLVSDSRSVLDGPLYAGQAAARINDLTVGPGLLDGRLQPVLLDWRGLNAPPLSLLIRRPLAREPRMRAWVNFFVEVSTRLKLERQPAGLPPVMPSLRPDWWRRRVPARGSHPV